MKDLTPPSRTWPAALGVLLVIVVAAGVYRFTSTTTELPSAGSAAAVASVSLLPPRCVELAPGASFRVGPAKTGAPVASAAEPTPAEGPDRDDLLSPFAIIVGRAAPFAGGFAVGVLGDAEGGSVSSVALIAADGSSGKTVRLARSRGDLDPPVVAPAPGDGPIYAAMLEPNASGRAIRLAKIVGDEVTWGAELPEGKDESTAIDLAVTARHGVVAWDGLEDDRAFVSVAGFALDSFATVTAQRRATSKQIDADSPRLTAREGGFFLAYLVHGHETEREAAADRGKDDDAPPKAPKKRQKDAKGAPKPDKTKASDDVDEAKGGESVSATWVEVVPLDETGAQASDALRVTPPDATVTSFDVGLSADGSLVVAYRDDDAPTGGIGGQTHVVRVHAGGFGPVYNPPEPLPSDGIPSVLSGWLGIPTLSGPDLLAKLGADGLPSEAPEREPSLGLGEPIAARGDQLLLADPDGRAMTFRVVTCGPRVVVPRAPEPEE